MTLKETRQLGIEFERKLQTIDATTKIANKVDSQDIYAYLNMYQEQYIKQLYILDQQVDSDTRSSNRIHDILQPLACAAVDENPKKVNDYTDSFNVPDDYWLFSRAGVDVTGTYKNYKEIVSVPCIEMKQTDIRDIIDTGFDKNRIIREPIISLTEPREVIHDRYTNIVHVAVRYYRKPKQFSILTDTPCELPMTCFEDLATGAAELYFNDKYKLAIASAAARRQNRQQSDDNNDQTA